MAFVPCEGTRMIRYELMGVETLAKALKQKSETDFKRVEGKNLMQMRDRAVSSADPSRGGTPRDSGELRLSARVDLNRGFFGYTKDYAPHVNYGHRQQPGRYVPAIGKRLKASYVRGKNFLGANVNIQRRIFREDLVREMRK